MLLGALSPAAEAFVERRSPRRAKARAATRRAAVRAGRHLLHILSFGCCRRGSLGTRSPASRSSARGAMQVLAAYPLLVDGALAVSFVAGMSLANLGGRLFWPSVSARSVPNTPHLRRPRRPHPRDDAVDRRRRRRRRQRRRCSTRSSARRWRSPLLRRAARRLPVFSPTSPGKRRVDLRPRPRELGVRRAHRPEADDLLPFQRWTSSSPSSPPRSTHQVRGRLRAPVDELVTLAAAKTVTIPKLLELLPPGTPMSTCCTTTMYSLSGVAGMAFVANALVRPVGKSTLPAAAAPWAGESSCPRGCMCCRLCVRHLDVTCVETSLRLTKTTNGSPT